MASGLSPVYLQLALTPVVVSGNRLQGLQGNGIAIETLLVSAKIEQNVFNAINGNGVIMLPGSAAGSMSVLANELINIANGTARRRPRAANLPPFICEMFSLALSRTT